MKVKNIIMSKKPEVPSQDEIKKNPFNEIKKVIVNQALIEQQPSLIGLNQSSLETDNSKNSIYYGTGLTTPKAPAVGLPFDVLGMILVAEQLRRAGGFGSIIHHIADTHAKTNNFIDPNAVDKLASDVKNTLLRVASNLKIENLKVILASDFDTTRGYKNELTFFQSKSKMHEYVIREMADINYYRAKYNLSLKLGWIIQGSETAIGADERLFDGEYVRVVGPENNRMSFIYTKPGRTFDPSRPKASPYIQVPGENRLNLKKGEDVAKKISEAKQATGDPNLGGAIKHLDSIVRTYERLYGAFDKVPLEQKLQNIIDTITK